MILEWYGGSTDLDSVAKTRWHPQENTVWRALSNREKVDGVYQKVIGPTHVGVHTIDLILTFGLRIENYSQTSKVWNSESQIIFSFKMFPRYNIFTMPQYCNKWIFMSATAQSFSNNLPEFSTLIGLPSDPTELDQATKGLQYTVI